MNAYAYQFDLSTRLETTLKFRLEETVCARRKTDIQGPGAVVWRGVDITGCLMFSLPVPPELLISVPARILVLHQNTKRLPDFGYDQNFNCFLVSERVVSILEELEPRSHQFLTIAEAADVNGERIQAKYFLMNVSTRLAPFDIEKSSLIKLERPDAPPVVRADAGAPNTMKFVADRAAIGAHHIWRGNSMGLMGAYFCSRTLKERFEYEGVTGIDYVKALT